MLEQLKKNENSFFTYQNNIMNLNNISDNDQMKSINNTKNITSMSFIFL